MRLRRPGLARWSMPRMPYMSPAAMGCSVVRPRGCPVASNRSPIAASTASGQPRPDEEETVTTEPSPIRLAASLAEMRLLIVSPVAFRVVAGCPRDRPKIDLSGSSRTMQPGARGAEPWSHGETSVFIEPGRRSCGRHRAPLVWTAELRRSLRLPGDFGTFQHAARGLSTCLTSRSSSDDHERRLAQTGDELQNQADCRSRKRGRLAFQCRRFCTA